MHIVDFAKQYVADKQLAKNPIHSASRFAKLMGGVSVYEINADMLSQFRRKCETMQLGAWTIRDTLKDVRTLVRASGRDVEIDRVKKPDPNPQPISFRTIDAIWPHLASWSQQWLVLSFWTALRLADSIRFQRAFEGGPLAWTASKTKHKHKWPTPSWMEPFLDKRRLPYSSTDDWSKAIVRAEIDRVCSLANVERFTPQQVRDTGLREWCRADFYVGQVLHGCKLGTIGHYVDVLDILEPVAPRVRIPSCFGSTAAESTEDTLLCHFRRLDPAAQGLITGTAERLAAG